MARIRTIKPEFWSSKTLARVSRESRLTFIGLWSLCDDLGITLDTPKKIAGDLYPYEEITGNEIDAQLNELESHGLIVRVSENNKDFIIITSWYEHQKVDKPSKFSYLSRESRESLALGKGKREKGSGKREAGKGKREAGSGKPTFCPEPSQNSGSELNEENSIAMQSAISPVDDVGATAKPLAADKEADGEALDGKESRDMESKKHAGSLGDGTKRKSEVVIELPLNEANTFHSVTRDDVAEYQELYPAVDVLQELRNMKGWCNDNPSKRKTKTGVRKFIGTWLAKRQNAGGILNFAPITANGSQAPPKRFLTKAEILRENNRRAGDEWLAESGNIYEGEIAL